MSADQYTAAAKLRRAFGVAEPDLSARAAQIKAQVAASYSRTYRVPYEMSDEAAMAAAVAEAGSTVIDAGTKAEFDQRVQNVDQGLMVASYQREHPEQVELNDDGTPKLVIDRDADGQPKLGADGKPKLTTVPLPPIRVLREGRWVAP